MDGVFMDGFQMAYTVLGGLGIFFLGIKYLSESLQAVAGDLMRRVINWLTTNRILAVCVGTLVTMIVQSSSITTVMVVGMVNAGLMNLTQAIGVIFGANIGTTITGWIIAIKVGKYGLLFIAGGIFPMLFMKSDNWKAIGKILVSLGFIFIGLKFMSGAFKPLRSDPTFLTILQYFTADTYISVLGCIAIGCILTFIIQSSSAMLAITIALAFTGAITFQTAMALVLGENIGTTITAILASVGTNVTAKRAARAHATFNLIGVLFMTLIFWKYVHFIEWAIMGDANFIDAEGNKPYIAAHIAAGHSIFNVTASLLFLPFLNYLAKFVTMITPGDALKEKTSLVTLRAGSMAPALGLEQAKKEIDSMMIDLEGLLHKTQQYVALEKDNPKLLDEIIQLESQFDMQQKDATIFLCNVMESPLTAEQSSIGYGLIRASDEIESVSDYCELLSKLYCRTLQKGKHKLSVDAKKEFHDFLSEVIAYYHELNEHNKAPADNPIDLEEFIVKGHQINHHAERVRQAHMERIREGKCTALSGLTFSDMIVASKRIKNHTVNMLEALNKATPQLNEVA
jgi:phosphate:Na+ symporter